MKAKPLPSLEYLNECFEVSDESPTGLIWKARPRHHFKTNYAHTGTNNRQLGKAAGNIWIDYRDPRIRYWNVMITGKTYYNHRIIYSILHNVEIESDIEIDHKDCNGLNNAALNLRLATPVDNGMNKSLCILNSSGFKGVNWHSGWKAWIGRVTIGGVRVRTDPCPTPEIASALIRQIREKYHKEFTNHG